MAKRRRKKDALDLHMAQMGIEAKRDPEMRAFAREIKIAEMIYAARKAAGLTQSELARAIGTKQQVISQLEDADYRGHSLSMLQRIADALHVELEVRFKKSRQRAG